ncbi:hypothetical protein B0J13DRAFT_600146 [Dactylonectria estremocensis]|uniref:Nonselective cation channel n=1 Tax=Dactylonectria estremocensis TaxID=1079267 RepID=A0A9P9ICC5_9HYPO|nr:hypothetical protein B0J13DRAFT_600146 [Dactylonectria estremocensis]
MTEIEDETYIGPSGHDSRGQPEFFEVDESVETERWLRDEHSQQPPPVFTTIHRVRKLVIASIDDPYTLDQLTGPRMNKFVIRPLVDRLYDADDISTVYCLLANRVQFLREQSVIVHQTVNIARATLCELVATRILRRFHEDNPGPMGLLLLSKILVEGFDPFSGAPEEVTRSGRYRQWPVQERGGFERKLMTLELAILSESKNFISSQTGQVVYTPLSFVDILPDHYKHHPVSLYDPRKAPLLNHYRLIVPRSRNIIELVQFIILVALYVVAMAHRNSSNLSLFEAVFVVYTAGWVLNEFAAIIEHGWAVHSQNLWSFLDITFTLIFGVYICARIYDISVGHIYDGIALHVLCVAAPVLLTRIAFNLMPDNIVFISLHAMMKDFMVLTFLAGWCVAGFFLALQWLVMNDDSTTGPKWYTVVKWLLWIWFGLDGTGIEESVQFHVILGPALMVAFAFLGNTLFLTILVALLTNTFSRIVAAETAEIQFRRAVQTFEGVKSDAIFAYPPPFNLLALIILLPLKFLVSPRTFHTIHVAMVRVLNAPTLLLITIYERRRIWAQTTTGGSKSFLRWQFTGFSPHGDIQAVFEAEAPLVVQEEADELDGLSEMGFSDHDIVSRPSREIKPPAAFLLGSANAPGDEPD